MDGIHDLGGMEGFGAIAAEEEEPTFHEPWGVTAFALNLLSIGVLRPTTPTRYRHAIERMPPARYLTARYYERVLTGVASLLVEKGRVTPAGARATRRRRFPPGASRRAGSRAREGSRRRPTLRGWRSRASERDPPVGAHAGSPLRPRRNGRRTPRRAAVLVPRHVGHGLPRRKEATYHVEFAARDLWAEAAGPRESVIVDLWETYLEPADG